MSLTNRELWTLIHGMGLGALFLLSFAGGLAGLYSLRPEWVTTIGIRERVRRLDIGTWVMAIVAWLTVITGTWIVYPWYRAPLPADVKAGVDAAVKAGTTLPEAVKDFPRQFLVNTPSLEKWHEFGMEWKEHIAWIAPILATAVAFIVIRYGWRLAKEPRMRNALITLFFIAFAAAGVAGLFGALITKAAPVQ